MAQQVFFVAARGEAAAPPPPRAAGASRQSCQAAASAAGVDRVLGEGVEDRAVVGRVEQAALLELALDLDEAVAELAQQPDARRLVVDKGAAAAVGADQPAQHDRLAVAVEPGLAQDRVRRVVAPDRELGRHRRLLAPRPHQPGLGPLAERQAQRIQQDRFAGAGLAGQHAQPRPEGEVEAVDQDNVADSRGRAACVPIIP